MHYARAPLATKPGGGVYQIATAVTSAAWMPHANLSRSWGWVGVTAWGRPKSSCQSASITDCAAEAWY